MKTVFVTVDVDARGKESINEVFASYIEAEAYTINTLFACEKLYSRQTLDFLKKAAQDRICERRIIGA
jgi:hypothetical protein